MPLSFDQAQAVIAGAHEHAAQLGVRITAVVVDEGGQLQALGRMDGAPPLSARIAEAKAVSAALFRRTGAELSRMQAAAPAFFGQLSEIAGRPIAAVVGSLLIERPDGVAGAVAVSGALPEQDQQCAAAGLALLP